MKRINYQQDWGVRLAWELPPIDCDFRGVASTKFTVQPYCFGRRGGEYYNCREAEGGLLVVFDSHELAPGELTISIDVHVPDSTFPDGWRKVPGAFVSRGEIELVDGDGGEYEWPDVAVSMPFMVATVYDIAKRLGYSGTQADYYDALADMPGAVEQANNAATEATTAAEIASAATTEAERVTRLAELATTYCNTAKEDTIAATEECNKATQAAELATTNTNQRIEVADGLITTMRNTIVECEQSTADSADMIQQANQAITNANSATSEARGAKADAEAAAAAAVGAANDAASAAASCRAEAEAAGRAATEANTAALAADTAAGRASDAATAAEGAAATANTAAANADAAKGRADAAATAADAAKERADDAATAATIAANGAAAVVGQVEAAVDGLNQYDDRIAEAEEEAERLVRDLAQYEAEEAISLAVGTSGKVVNTAGALVARSGFAVSQPMRLRKGYTYLYRPLNGQPLPEGVALCARLVTTDTPVVIDYDYTYDALARPVTATARHNGASYSLSYDDEGVATITDSEGAMVQGLPQYRIAQANTYVPMFVSLSQTMPRSGYYAVLCNEDCMAVWSAALVGGVLGSVEVTSYGFVRSLVNQKEDKAVVKQLQERVGEIGAVVSRLEAAEFAALPMELEHTTYDMQVIEGRSVYSDGVVRVSGVASGGIEYYISVLRLEAGVHYIDYLASQQYSYNTVTLAMVADCDDIDARLAVGQSVDGVLVPSLPTAANSPQAGMLRLELSAPCWLVHSSRAYTQPRKTPPRFDVYRLAEARPSMNAATRLADECSLAAAAVQLQPGQALMKIRRGREYRDVKASAAHDTWAVVPYTPGGGVGSPDVLAIAAINLGSYNNSVCTGFQNCEYLDPRGLFGFASAGMDNAFANCMTLRELDLTGLDMSRAKSPANMFSGCINLRRIYGIEDFDMGAATLLYNMFYCCQSLTELDLSQWDVSNVTNMSYMFYLCQSLETLDLSGFNTTNVVAMDAMFAGCYNLHFLRVGENFFRTRQTIDLSQCSLLGREGSTNNSNGWLEHFAATAPQITDGQARTIKLHSAIKGYAWAIPYINQLTSKGYSIA